MITNIVLVNDQTTPTLALDSLGSHSGKILKIQTQLTDNGLILQDIASKVDTEFFSIITANVSFYRDKIKKSLEYIQIDDSISIAYSDYDLIKNGKTQRVLLNPYDIRLVLSGMPIPLQSVYRTSFIRKTNKDFIQSLVGQSRLIHVSESLYCERQYDYLT